MGFEVPLKQNVSHPFPISRIEPLIPRGIDKTIERVQPISWMPAKKNPSLLDLDSPCKGERNLTGSFLNTFNKFDFFWLIYQGGSGNQIEFFLLKIIRGFAIVQQHTFRLSIALN